jgi:hypothetical protein
MGKGKGKGKGKVVERKKEKKKRGRPSLSDVRKRTLKEQQQQKRNHNSAPHSASNYPLFVPVPVPASGPAPLRRSPRLNPNPYAHESDEICSEESDPDESADERGSMRKMGRMTDEERVRYREQVCRTDVSKINSLRLCIYVRICLCLQL